MKHFGLVVIFFFSIYVQGKVIAENTQSSVVDLRPSTNSQTEITDYSTNNGLFYVLNNKYIVLRDGDYYSLSVGDARRADISDLDTAIKNIDYNGVDKNLFKYIGQTFTIVDKNNIKHSAKIVKLLLYTKYYPHFGESQTWFENNLSEAQIANEIWNNSIERSLTPLIIGELDEIIENSAIALNTKDIPVIYTKHENITSDAIQSICKTTEGYQSFLKDLNSLEDISSNEKDFTLTTYINPIDNTELIYARLSSGHPCGKGYYYFQVCILIKNNNGYRLIKDYNPCMVPPECVFKLSTDIYPESMYFSPMERQERYIDSLNRKYQNIGVAFYDCGC